jgi:cephalosporin hydroxylase
MSDGLPIQQLGLFFQNAITTLEWSELPFNGQLARANKISQIIAELRPFAILETGTYHGTTTQFLASISECKVYTIEFDQHTASIAVEMFVRTGSSEQIEVHLGDSARVTPEIVSGLNSFDKPFLAYLDAHWGNELPLSAELKSLSKWRGPCVIVIDDFYVPSFPNYGFDVYGDTHIGPEIIPKNYPFTLYVPNESHLRETGARRGTGYLLNEAAEAALSESFFADLYNLDSARNSEV